MIRVLESLLAFISLLLLAMIAAAANGATWQEVDTAGQGVSAEPAVAARPHLLPGHHYLVPGPQPGTRLQGQPFAYGYFGARPQTTAVYHRSSNGDWFQWSFVRAN